MGERRVNVLGCGIDALDMAGTVERCRQVVATRAHAQQVSVNAGKLMAMHDDAALRDIVGRCELVNADGQAIVWASRLLGDPLPERVAGIDLMHELIALAEREGYRVFFLGARPEVLERAVSRISEAHPRLAVAGSRDGYFADGESDEVCRQIRDARTDILFVAISSPRKERWLAAYRDVLDVPLVMGVGGALDVVAGVRRRAPLWAQRHGLEWLFRFAQEPRRLGHRYVVENGRFLALLAVAMGGRLAGRPARGGLEVAS